MGGLRDLFFKEAFDNAANVKSGADALRPPYKTGLNWVAPETPGAAVSLEQALNRMPPVYRSALERVQDRGAPIRAGATQAGVWNVGGLYNRNLETGLRRLVGEDAQSYVHELMHALVDQKGARLDPHLDEELARVVAGDKPQYPMSRPDAQKLDAFIQNPPGALKRFFWDYGPLLQKADRIRQ